MPGPVSALDTDRLFAPILGEKRVGLAVSGGPDSLALLILYARWAQGGVRPEGIVYTLDHGLRPESEIEARFVAEVAARFGLKCHRLVWNGEKPGTGLQAAARQARYRLIGDAMARDGVGVLMTAHHKRDQAETVLMRLAHGSGIAGLKGMQRWGQAEGVSLFRPLLDEDPGVLAQLVRDYGITAIADPSNENQRFERVRWRAALPTLDALGLTVERISALADRMTRIDALAERQVDLFWDAAAGIDALGVVGVDSQALASVPEEIAIRALGRAIAIGGDGEGGGLAQIEALWQGLATGARSGTLGGARIMRRADRLLVFREAGRIGGGVTALVPETPLVWDRRFVISGARPGLVVAPAKSLTRKAYEALTGTDLRVPAAAVQAAPLVTDAAGSVLAIGTIVLGQGVAVSHGPLTPAR